MKVIFLQDVPRVGKRHDIKEINDGYAMNFLIPRKLVERATPKAIAELEARKKNIQIEKEVQEDLLMKNLEGIKDKVVHIQAKADDKGHLFKGIHAREISVAMHTEHLAEIAPEFIDLKKPIKEIGEFEIPISITTTAKGGARKSSFKLVVEKI
ncbi:50S ribosomal protein L9 [Candidatus Nomurabacteria bacterium CG10_big_fil_rev_8_21_14_0_10_35_16]|uniref:Large ribosomal subunit protein bL9 n=1 Tax=Candidatus Nomurabacteria bacterium CG10_big_fil_rev_8_21_14_0_10_35_16 TaxID=1974731 RepID=A0A2H0TC67_9BACT|nr:MAG: 50S ribosomal protein L9 [Candidatus Nomurabacteria bacterium CG10_big_fil_rev_8_21_14_0_10_35_16]